MLTAISSHLLAIIAILITIRHGQRPERIGAATIFLMIIISDSRYFANYAVFSSVDYVALACDVVGLCGFSISGVFYNRIWPLWAAALQLLSVGAHFVRALDIPVRPIVYAWMKSGPTWAVIILLICATLMNRNQRNTQIGRTRLAA